METNNIELKDFSLGANTPTEVSSSEIKVTKKTNWLEQVIFTLNNITHKISCIVLFLMMTLTTFDVIGRNFLGEPITGAYELTGLSLALMIFFSLGMVQIKKDHIEIDFLTNKFSEKVQAAMNVVTSLIVFVLIMLTTWQLFQYTKDLMASGEFTGDLGWQLYPFVILAAIGSFFFALSFILDIVRSIVKVVQA